MVKVAYIWVLHGEWPKNMAFPEEMLHRTIREKGASDKGVAFRKEAAAAVGLET